MEGVVRQVAAHGHECVEVAAVALAAAAGEEGAGGQGAGDQGDDRQADVGPHGALRSESR